MEITNGLAPRLDPNIDWVQIRKNGAAQVIIAKTVIIKQRGTNSRSQLKIGNVDLSTVNKEQDFFQIVSRSSVWYLCPRTT